jgi:hypothetical protein
LRGVSANPKPWSAPLSYYCLGGHDHLHRRPCRVYIGADLPMQTCKHISKRSSLHFILTTFKVQKSWIPATVGSCLANVPTFTGLAIVTIVYDIIIFLLPIPLLWTLQIRKRRKIALMGVFLLGLFTTLCSFLRLSRIAPLAIDGNSTYLVLWGTIELNVGVSSVISLPSISTSHAD